MHRMSQKYDTNSISNNGDQHSPHLQGELNADTANDYGFNSELGRVHPGLARMMNLDVTNNKSEGATDYGSNSDNAHAYPGLARTNVAATIDKPDGTTEDGWAEKHKHLTVMQQHCVYWDSDGDGIIWPQDTYNGCRAWGWNIILSVIATILINGNLSYPTGAGLLPDPYV
jgi:hypothetical protein